MKRERHPPSTFLGFLKALAAMTGQIPHIVAGQAINIWAEIYHTPDLEKHRPYTSGDLEIFQTPIPKTFENALPDEKLKKGNPFSRTSSADTAFFSYKENGKLLTVSVMGSLTGLTQKEITKYSVELEYHGIQIKILDPIAIAKGKAKNALVYEQENRQDVKHLKMAVACSKAHIANILSQAKPALKTIERIIELSTSPTGKKIAKKFGIDWFACIPWEELGESAKNNPSLAGFLKTRAPQWRKMLEQPSDKTKK